MLKKRFLCKHTELINEEGSTEHKCTNLKKRQARDGLVDRSDGSAGRQTGAFQQTNQADSLTTRVRSIRCHIAEREPIPAYMLLIAMDQDETHKVASQSDQVSDQTASW